MIRTLLVTTLFVSAWQCVLAQCCAGGSGSPIAGGASQGVLQQGQMEIGTNYQYVRTSSFFKGDKKDTTKYFDNFNSRYLYSRMAYGVTKDFTMSVEAGYYLNKTEVGLDELSNTYESGGIGDLILFPRYDVLNRTSEEKRSEITLGLGFKIPLGKYNDSLKKVEPFSGTTYYITMPMAVQPSTGAHDLIFYSFFFRGYPLKNFRLFANALYVKKGWNPVGEKMGDYASVGLFAGKTFFESLGVTLQVKGEWNDKMKLNKNILLYAYPNYDPEATGYRKVFVVPQLSYTLKEHLTVYALAEMPVYQYVTLTQVGSQKQFTAGLSYRFFVKKSKTEE